MPHSNSMDDPPMISADVAAMHVTLERIAVTTDHIKEDQAAIRKNQHDLRNDLQPLMGIPEQMREMKAQHLKMQDKIDTVLAPLEPRVTALEGDAKTKQVTIDGLVAVQNQGKGAIWAGRIYAGIVGAMAAALAYLGFIKHS